MAPLFDYTFTRLKTPINQNKTNRISTRDVREAPNARRMYITAYVTEIGSWLLPSLKNVQIYLQKLSIILHHRPSYKRIGRMALVVMSYRINIGANCIEKRSAVLRNDAGRFIYFFKFVSDLYCLFVIFTESALRPRVRITLTTVNLT